MINAVVQEYQNEIRIHNVYVSGKGVELLSLCDNTTESDNNSNNLMIVADQNRIYQVICNLVNNAITFTNEGTVSITATMSNKGGSGKDVTISVKDSGTGVDPEILPQLFTKFATKSNEVFHHLHILSSSDHEYLIRLVLDGVRMDRVPPIAWNMTKNIGSLKLKGEIPDS